MPNGRAENAGRIGKKSTTKRFKKTVSPAVSFKKGFTDNFLFGAFSKKNGGMIPSQKEIAEAGRKYRST